ncbi:diguanylate cyclase [Algibacillus agarilyticus]|uniref:diguanylate cyclase n=1 Tax=Algibacillus agarilyticus TaxID=2234133 RepID=UPI000DD05B4C|nr:diguanylate cyclase [Algibacillus agarilyticus]
MSVVNKPTILIVDDEPLNIKVLGQALSGSYRVKTAINGTRALAISNEEAPPDLILLDIQMPDIDGYEVLVTLKQSDHTKSIPVIFITGRDNPEDEARGLELGAMDYITKPFNIPVVMARVRNQLALKQKADLLEKLVSIDGLTEIPNRRNFDEILDKEWRRCLRAGLPLSMIMIDIDCFKLYNDNYGHAKGDDVLKKVANALSNTLNRASDFVARYGGEEFVVLLPETPIDSAGIVAEALKNSIVDMQITHKYNTATDFVTISLGLACCVPTNTIEPLTLHNKADNMLYEAKGNGRNQVVAVPKDDKWFE